MWLPLYDGVTKCFRTRKFLRTFTEEASGWRTRDTDIRHDCQLIPHFADVSVDKFELANAANLRNADWWSFTPLHASREKKRYSRSWNSYRSRWKNMLSLPRKLHFQALNLPINEKWIVIWFFKLWFENWILSTWLKRFLRKIFVVESIAIFRILSRSKMLSILLS